MAASGDNLGNLAFWHASRKLFDGESVLLSWNATPPKNLKCLVIPAANFIGPHFNLAPLVQLIKKADVPCVVIGLGAQAPSQLRAPDFAPGVIDFLREASARTPFLGLRGAYSAKTVNDLGIQNCRALGCPSILTRGVDLTEAALKRSFSQVRKDGPVVIHGQALRRDTREVEFELFRIAQLNAGSSYVIQRPRSLVRAINGEQQPEHESEPLRDFAQFFGISVSEADLFLRVFGYLPTSIDDWMHYLRRFRMSVNTRIHGNIVSINAGIPSICVTHDSRTEEMADLMHLPTATMAEFVEARHNIEDLIQVKSEAFTGFDAYRNSAAKQYLELFQGVGIQPSSHLLSLAA